MSTLTGTLVLNGVSGEGVLRLTPPNPNRLINSAGGPGSISPATIEIVVSGGELIDPPDVPGNDILLPLASVYQVEYRSDTGDELVGEWAIVGSPFDIGTQALAFPDGRPLTTRGPATYNAYLDPAVPAIVFQATLPDGTVGQGQVPLGDQPPAGAIYTVDLLDFAITQNSTTQLIINRGTVTNGNTPTSIDGGTVTIQAGVGSGSIFIYIADDSSIHVSPGDGIDYTKIVGSDGITVDVDQNLFNNQGIGSALIFLQGIAGDVWADAGQDQRPISPLGYPSALLAGDGIAINSAGDGPGVVVISATGGGGGGNSQSLTDLKGTLTDNTLAIADGIVSILGLAQTIPGGSISISAGAVEDVITIYAHVDGFIHCFPDIPDNAEFITTDGVTVDPDGTEWGTDSVGAIGSQAIGSDGNFGAYTDQRTMNGIGMLSANNLLGGAGVVLTRNPGPGTTEIALALTPDILPTFAHGFLLQANASTGEIETANLQMQVAAVTSDSLTLAPGATQQIEFDGTGITADEYLYATLQDYSGAGIPLIVSVSTIGSGTILVTIVNVGLAPMDSTITVNLLGVVLGGG